MLITLILMLILLCILGAVFAYSRQQQQQQIPGRHRPPTELPRRHTAQRS